MVRTYSMHVHDIRPAGRLYFLFFFFFFFDLAVPAPSRSFVWSSSFHINNRRVFFLATCLNRYTRIRRIARTVATSPYHLPNSLFTTQTLPSSSSDFYFLQFHFYCPFCYHSLDTRFFSIVTVRTASLNRLSCTTLCRSFHYFQSSRANSQALSTPLISGELEKIEK